MVWSAAVPKGQTITGGGGFIPRDGGVSVREVMAEESAPKALQGKGFGTPGLQPSELDLFFA
jgi:hypothetical protein